MNKKILTFAVTAILAISANATEQEKLRYVIDGDTVKFAKTTCRLAFIDTPESKMNNKLKRDIKKNPNVSAEEVIKAGRISKNYLQSVMRKGHSYKFDVIGTDRYKRSICVIYSGDGDSFNGKLVSNGFAVPFWRYVPSNIKQTMVKRVRSAKAQNKGLWRTNPSVMEMMN